MIEEFRPSLARRYGLPVLSIVLLVLGNASGDRLIIVAAWFGLRELEFADLLMRVPPLRLTAADPDREVPPLA